MRIRLLASAALPPLLLLAFADIPAPPAIDPGGVLNGASRMPASLPGGAIARGARFSLSGVRLGPESAVTGDQQNPPTQLGGVSVTIVQGETRVDAGLLLVSESRIEGWIPPSAPLGAARLSVTYQQRVSEPYALTIVDSGFGYFTSETIPDALVEAARAPSAVPGRTGALWGTGAGTRLEVLIGGRPAPLISVAPADCCRGVDRIEFTVPRDASLGCAVPVQARGPAGRVSNTVALAIHEPDRPCQDPVDWFRASVAHATRAGFVVLAAFSLYSPGTRAVEDFRFDYGLASFGSQESGQRPLPAIPPAHTCFQFTDRINLRQVIGQARSPNTWTFIPKPLPGNHHLDAGAFLSVIGPRGTKRLERDPRRREYYNALFGGRVPLLRIPPAPLFLQPGPYTVSADGGADIGEFSTKLRVVPPVAWKNRARVNEVLRSAGVTVEWTPSRKTDAILIAAGSSDRFTGDSALSVCMVPARDRQFTVPPLALANLPASGDTHDLEAGYLVIAEIPADPPERIRASGLDTAFAAFVSLSGRPVTYK
jgi:uncharacterized protein (TIGR03437 family)